VAWKLVSRIEVGIGRRGVDGTTLFAARQQHCILRGLVPFDSIAYLPETTRHRFLSPTTKIDQVLFATRFGHFRSLGMQVHRKSGEALTVFEMLSSADFKH
jgi:hypothetical protein